MIHIGNQTASSAVSATEPFEYALANRFDAFEWFPDKKPGAGWDETDLDGTKRRQLREKGHQAHMRFSVHARWQANPLQADSQSALMKDLQLAQDLGGVLFNIHLYHEAGIAAFIEAITPLLRQTSEMGVRLSIENTPHHSPQDFNELFERLRQLDSIPTSHVGMCLDIGHANLSAATRNDYLRFVDQLAPHVPLVHLHLHENWGDADTHLPLFTGPARDNDSGVRGLLKRLHERGFSGSIILEQWPQPPSLLNNARDRILDLLKSNDWDAPKQATTSNTSSSGQPASAPKSDHREPIADRSDFLQGLIAADQSARSWREKLDSVRELLSAHASSLNKEQLASVAIYLRFLSTGQIQCAEDGRHFRPGHHANIAAEIYKQLASLATPDLAFLARKILPWLPSTAQAFRRAEPLTRIRDIAHRNDIPFELKKEIKNSLQNKLHRCAGPEDLATSAALLKRITTPDANYSAEFVEQFKLFHKELEEFFNASSLHQRLDALLPHASPSQVDLIRQLLQHKTDEALPERLSAFLTLTNLRSSLLEIVKKQPGLETIEFMLTDIALEDYAFALVSELLNLYRSPETQSDWDFLLETLGLLLANLALSGLSADESRVISSEIQAWREDSKLESREHLLRLKASLDRGRRLAEEISEEILQLFLPRVEALGRALRVAEHAIRVFCEGEVRGQLVFQVSKLVSLLLREIRQQLDLPPWDVLVTGKAAGRVQKANSFSELKSDGSEPVIALLKGAEGDEEIPSGIAGIVLAHELPHLSHLAVRARQAGVVLVTSEDSAAFEKLLEQHSQFIGLTATAENFQLRPATSPGQVGHSRRAEPLQIPEVQVPSKRSWLPITEATTDNAGGKATNLRRLAELSKQPEANFVIPPALIIPFGVMEQALEASGALKKKVVELSREVDASQDIARKTEELRAVVRQIDVPREMVEAVRQQFGPNARLMVRSSANCEDLEKFAGAGLYDSVPNVKPEEVASAVLRVWSSLWTPRATLSRKQTSFPHQKAHMAVLIQEMVVPDYSFILHTVNPVTHKPREVYVELAVGLGETLASAAARGTPYRLVFDKESRVVSTLAFANFSHALLPSASGVEPKLLNYSQVNLSLNPEVRQTLGCRLGRIACFVENAYQAPQDIEGAIAGNTIYLLQARPEQVGSGVKAETLRQKNED